MGSYERRLGAIYDLLNDLPTPNFFLDVEVAQQGPAAPPTSRLRSELRSWLDGLDPDALLAEPDRYEMRRGHEHQWDEAGWADPLPADPQVAPICRLAGPGPPSSRPPSRGSGRSRCSPDRPPTSWLRRGLASAWEEISRRVSGGSHGAGSPVIRSPLAVISEHSWPSAGHQARSGPHQAAGRSGSVDPGLVEDEFIHDEDVLDGLFGTVSHQISFGPDFETSQMRAYRLRDGPWMTNAGPSNTRVSAVMTAINLGPSAAARVEPRLWHNRWAARPMIDGLAWPTTVVDPVAGSIDDRPAESAAAALFGLAADWPSPEDPFPLH